jgi:hypothetical protein
MAVAFRAVATSDYGLVTSFVFTLPDGVEEGDLLLGAIQFTGGSTITITPPSGWTSVLRTNDGTTAGQEVFRAIYAQSLGTSITFGLSGAGSAAIGILAAYGGVDHASPVDVSGGQANASSSSATAPSVATAKSNAHLVAFWGAATGARSATPPQAMTERADRQGSALAISCADVVQGTLGASGTKVATLSGASANIGQLIALQPAALNTPTQVRDEGNWRYEAFAPRVTTDTAMDALVEGLIQRMNREVFRMVGSSFYTQNVLADPWNTLLQRAEMHLVQAALLESAGQLVGTADDESTRPFLGTPGELRSAAIERRRRAREILALCRSASRPGPGSPFFSGGAGSSAIRPRFDREHGWVEE